MKKILLAFFVLFNTAVYAQRGLDLLKWKLLGIGTIDVDHYESAYKLTESNNSKGVVLLSKKKYSKNYHISFDVKPLQSKGVCVVFFSLKAANGKSLGIPDNYDGNSDFWTGANSQVRSYAVAFHTAFHQPNLLIKKNPGWISLSEIKDVVTEEKWYNIEIKKVDRYITFLVNGNIILEAKDESEDVLGKGRVGLRLRGPGDGSFSALYKNFRIIKPVK